jgi:hypothetical protein
MKRLLVGIFIFINIFCDKYFEITFFPSEQEVYEEYTSDTISHHLINTNIIRFNNFYIYDITNVLYNDGHLSEEHYEKRFKKLPGIQIEFRRSGEYLITLKSLSTKCIKAEYCKVTEKHLMKVNIGTQFRLLSQDIDTGTIVAIVFCVIVIVIVLLTVLLLFNMKKIRKWWYGNKKDDSGAYFPNLEESPNEVPYPFPDKNKSVELA